MKTSDTNGASKRALNKNKPRFTLINRIFLLICIVSVLPISLLISALTYNTSTSLKKEITTAANQINNLASSALSTILKHESAMLTVLANDTSLLNYANSAKDSEGVANKFKYIMSESSFISSISIKAEDQENAFTYPETAVKKLNPNDLDGLYFYKLSKKSKEVAVSDPYLDTLSKQQVITITAPILSNTNAFLGAITLDINMNTFSEYLNITLKDEKDKFPLEIMVYLNNGNILASTAGETTGTKLVLLPGGHSIVNNHANEFSSVFKGDKYHFYKGETVKQLNFITYISEESISDLIFSQLQPLMLLIATVFLVSMITGLLYTIHTLKPLQYIVHTLHKLKGNDLNIHIDTSKITTKDLLEVALVTNELVHHLASSVHNFSNTSMQLRKDASAVSAVSTQCNYYADATLNAVAEIKEGAKEQIIQVNNALSSISVLNDQCTNSDTIKTQLNEHSAYVISYVEQGIQTAKDLTFAVNTERDKLHELRTKVKDLGEKSSQIASILTTLQDISRKINLLAFNASIEATRAGQHGRGFSVIAQEMQQLADTSLNFTESIQSIVNDNIDSVSYVSYNMKQVILAEQTTEDIIEEVQKQFASIEQATALVEQSIKSVNNILTAVSLTKDTIATDMQTIFNISEKIIVLTRETEEYGNTEFATLQELLSTSENLTQSSKYLEEQIGQYTI